MPSLFGRVTYEMLEAAFRPPAGTGARPDWMEPFACTIDAAKKYVVSSTLDRVDWNAELAVIPFLESSRGSFWDFDGLDSLCYDGQWVTGNPCHRNFEGLTLPPLASSPVDDAGLLSNGVAT